MSSTSGPPISSFQARTTSATPSGVNSDGLITTAAPACSAAIESPRVIESGKFQGPITPTTGCGRYWTLSFFGARAAASAARTASSPMNFSAFVP